MSAFRSGRLFAWGIGCTLGAFGCGGDDSAQSSASGGTASSAAGAAAAGQAGGGAGSGSGAASGSGGTLGGNGGVAGSAGAAAAGNVGSGGGGAGNGGAAGLAGGGLAFGGAGGSASSGGAGGSGGSAESGGRGGAGGSAGAGGSGGAPLTSFVTRQGLNFMVDGKRHVFVGANFWQGMNLGAEAAAGGDVARLRRELDRLKALGVTNLRVVAASEGPDTEPYRTVPSLMPMPGVYNEQVFRGLDVLLDEMSRRGMRAVLVLNNYWEWTGGMAQYVSWSDGSKIPYRLDSGGEYQKYIDYVNRFYACSSCQATYRAHIKTLIERVSTVSARKYADEPAIFSWQLANEPRGYPANWINDTAGYIKSLDSKHMVSVGSEGTWGGDFTATHSSQNIDYTTCHIWVEPWGKYDPDDSSASALQTAITFATGYLRDHDTAAQRLGKPLVLEEFGLARDGWTATGKLDPAATTTNRNQYYRSLYAVVEASLAKAGGALAGEDFWAWGGEARPPSKWTGDPPHEPPGWFSVYDADTATNDLIRTHHATIVP